MGRKRSDENKHMPKGMIFNKKGSTFYYRCSGQKDIRLGKTFTEAYLSYENLLDVEHSILFMSDLIDRYLFEVSPSKAKKSQKEDIRISLKLKEAFGHFKPHQIKAKHARQYLDLRKSEGAPIGGNREYALWSSIMTSAFNWGVIDENPFLKAGIKKHPEKPRDRLVSDEELDAFLKFVPVWLKLYVELKLATGLRQRDMLQLNNTHWSDSEGLKIGTSKTSVRIQFESTEYLNVLIDKIKKLNAYTSKGIPKFKWYFFESRYNTRYTEDGFGTMWGRYMVKALASGELKKRFQEKDLRAKAATRCGSLAEAFELLGHKNISTTKRVY
jgi:integrase